METKDYQVIFDYIDEALKRQNEHVQEIVRNELVEIKGAIADLAGQIKTYHEEMIVMRHQMDRYDRWFKQIAQKVGITLEY
ncbi:MAG TPA: hypothetical protein VEA59_02260 [Patescibacteria group bacterium]|nr:hypothetical protein [Patescibacteria group bacterium]